MIAQEMVTAVQRAGLAMVLLTVRISLGDVI
jgi:hypothetical protein